MKKFLILIFLLQACSTPQPGPDKTIAGAVLGAGWGAGAGAVVGNQISEFPREGEGAAIGAGFGLVSGALQGAGYDLIESDQIKQEQELEALAIQNQINGQNIAKIQARLDNQDQSLLGAKAHQVFFEPDATNLKTGSINSLETIADAIIQSPRIAMVKVHGHTDDTGDKEYNRKLSLARAMTVASYLQGRGISKDRISTRAHGADKPVASNQKAQGRQLNRRVEVYVDLN